MSRKITATSIMIFLHFDEYSLSNSVSNSARLMDSSKVVKDPIATMWLMVVATLNHQKASLGDRRCDRIYRGLLSSIATKLGQLCGE